MARNLLMEEVGGMPVRIKKTEVSLDGWCDGGLGQQRNDGGGCASIKKKPESGEPWYIYVTE